MGLFSRLFAREPAYHESAYHGVYKAVVARLTRQGVIVGKTAHIPRIEVHTITEGERLDKEGEVRQLNLTVESISNSSLAAAVAMNEKNIELLTSELVLPEGWTCLGVVPEQLQDLTESSDTNKIIYRQLQSFAVWVQRIKTDPEEEQQGTTQQETPAQQAPAQDEGQNQGTGTGSNDTPLGPAHEGSNTGNDTPDQLAPGHEGSANDSHRH